MMKKLPTGGFDWSDIILDKIMQKSDESDVGYFVMVDLNYPSNLHDNHIDFPLAAEKLKIDTEMLSQYQLAVLKFYCQQGLQVTRLHKTLKFNQRLYEVLY